MIRVEIGKLLRRPRTWVSLALLTGLPVVVAIFLAVTDLGPRPGEGPAFLSAVLNNGSLFPAAALAIVLPLFLPMAVATVAGDSIAGEASSGTLRYLLVQPVSRTRLLFAKLVTVVFFTFLAVILVAGVAYEVGTRLFGSHPLPTVSGGAPLTTAQATIRVVLAVLYVGWSMLGVGAFGLFFSTITDSPLAASLGSLAVLISSTLLVTLEAAGSVSPYLPTRYWLAFVDLFRNPILWHDVQRGIALQAVYMVVLLGVSWANFASKDITS